MDKYSNEDILLIEKIKKYAESLGTIHISQPLSNVSVEFKQPKNIWTEVLKPVPVPKDTDSYYIFGEEDFRYYGQKREDGTPAVRVKPFTSSTDTYTCLQESYDALITDKQRNKADKPIRLEPRTVQRLTNIIDRSIEVEVAATIFNASNFTDMTSAPTTNWDTSNDGSPLKDIDYAKTQVQQRIGIDPNIMVIGRQVFDQLKRHGELRDYLKYTQKVPYINTTLMAELFGVEKVIVGDQIYITSKPGQTTVTRGYVWGKYCALLYIPQNAAIDEPSWGYTFLHKLFGGLTAEVLRYRANALRGTVVEVSRSFTPKVTGKKAGYLYTSVVS